MNFFFEEAKCLKLKSEFIKIVVEIVTESVEIDAINFANFPQIFLLHARPKNAFFVAAEMRKISFPRRVEVFVRNSVEIQKIFDFRFQVFQLNDNCVLREFANGTNLQLPSDVHIAA